MRYPCHHITVPSDAPRLARNTSVEQENQFVRESVRFVAASSRALSMRSDDCETTARRVQMSPFRTNTRRLLFVKLAELMQLQLVCVSLFGVNAR